MQLNSIKTDKECDRILRDFASGNTTEDETRKLIAEALHRHGIVQEVVREARVYDRQVEQDLAENLTELLTTKVLQPGKGNFNPVIALGCSTVGWARVTLRALRGTQQRTLQNRAIRTALVDPAPTDDDDADMSPVMQRFHRRPVRPEPVDDPTREMEDAVDWLRSKTRHLRDNSRVAANAAAIRYGYRVPDLVRHRMTERKRLKTLVDADPMLAHRSVIQMRDLVAKEPVRNKVDPGLLELWGDYAFDHLDRVASADPEAAIALVDAALADRARPSRAVLRSFRASVRALGAGRGWPSLADEAAEAFLALEFEAYSAFDSSGSEYRDEKVAGRTILCLKASDVFARALAYPGQRLGVTEDDLYEQLDRLIRSLTDFDVKAPEAAA